MTDNTLENQNWELKVQNNRDKGFRYILHSKIDNVDYANEEYHYRILTSSKKGSRYAYLLHLGSEYKAKKLSSREIRMEGIDKLIIEGKFEDTDIIITHEFKLEEDSKWLVEKITLTNRGSKKIRFGLINLGFKKALFKQYTGWCDNLDEFTLTSIPTRRFFGYGNDRRKENFSANDIMFNSWIEKEAEMPGFCSEGWLWGNDQGGLLMCKYNPSQLEYSRFQRLSTTLPGRGAEDVDIIFGGVSLYKGNPELATVLEPNGSYTFGMTKYAVYQGDYKEGYYLYRSHLDGHGHKFKQDYDPPVHWNELYNLGWIAEKTGFFVEGTEFEVYSLEQLYEEAEIARDIGAESLYLDPGWNIALGSSIWNEGRFGSLNEFSKVIHDKYDLKLALHLMMNFEGENEPDEFYLRSKTGVKVVADPYINLFSLCANNHWVEEKTQRILELAKEGVDFFMFDFTDFSTFMVDNLGCFSKEHGHEVPMLRNTHAENIFKVVQNVKNKFPHILIEAHDRGVIPRHPLYYQHSLPHSFDENWGFECMWNPMQDLLSGRSTQLFEYNLAYSIPLYLHINENSDNENMLQFWWYASLARHLGIGGLKDKSNPKYLALKQAMRLYKTIKSIMTRGIFFGLDYNVHLHMAEDNASGVITAYNLTSRKKKVIIQSDLSNFGLQVSRAEFYNGKNELLYSSILKEPNFEIDIPPLSPVIVILKK